MNRVFLIGRLTKDPELRYTTGNNAAVCNFTIAVDRTFQGQNGEREADFIPVVVWNKQAENVKNYLTKGSQVAVEGRMQVRNYEDQNGQKRYVTEVIANSVEFLGSKNSNNANQSSSSSSEEPTPYDFADEPSEKGTSVDKNPFADFGQNIEISDDELPF
ncbi:MAG: single-stranded DNA-binding protein [Bacilli bacterium]|nr:single-stranded DNA-binding protein [Bacilli bacterium]MBQ6538695.1 single-stranded DNA-binding protein [Bacilli bacterium]